MYIAKAEAEQVEKTADMSVRASEAAATDSGIKGERPPDFGGLVYKYTFNCLPLLSGRLNET